MLHLAGRAARAGSQADLPAHVLGRVLHEDRGVGVALGHLRLPRLQAHHHVVRQDDGLVLNAHRGTVLPGLHVHLALVQPQLTDVRLQQEDVRALHQWVEDLGCRQIPFLSTHNGAAPAKSSFLSPFQELRLFTRTSEVTLLMSSIFVQYLRG